MKKLAVITGNPHKAEQLAKYLGFKVNQHNLDLTEVQSLDVGEVIEHKALEAFKSLKQPVIVDDTALIIHAMGKLPGPFIKFFLKEIGAKGICEMVSHFSDKSATVESAIGYHDGSRSYVFIGTVKGIIAQKPKGQNGFGFDPIFIPNGYTITRGEMNEADFDITSHRRIALEKLKAFLVEQER